MVERIAEELSEDKTDDGWSSHWTITGTRWYPVEQVFVMHGVELNREGRVTPPVSLGASLRLGGGGRLVVSCDSKCLYSSWLSNYSRMGMSISGSGGGMCQRTPDLRSGSSGEVTCGANQTVVCDCSAEVSR